MTKHKLSNYNPSIWLLLALGACSADATFKDVFPPMPTTTYRYKCTSNGGSVGIADRGGALSVYKNDTVQFANHPGGDLSFFLTTQEPSDNDPYLRGFALENQTESDLEFYALSLEMNADTGVLIVGEEKYTRSTPQDPWNLSNIEEILNASGCRTP